MEQKVAGFIEAEGLLRPTEKVLLACSGGADSTCLLHILKELKINFICAHINHQLRGGEAKRDEDFVVDQCRKLDIDVITKKINVQDYAGSGKLSIETAARKLRIDALIDIAANQNCSCIATAHQKNDNAETILHRLSRGTGLRGLCGIWPEKHFAAGIRFVRPLLGVSRDEIIQYLESRNIKWCTDKTNDNLIYKRNLIRHRLLPSLQKNCAGRLADELFELSRTCREFHQLICKKAGAIWPNVAALKDKTILLNAGALASQHPEIRIEIIRRALANLSAGEREITEKHYGLVLRLSENETGQLPGGIEVRRQGGAIVFAHGSKEVPETSTAEPVALKVPGVTEFADMLIEAETFDYDASGFEKFKTSKNNYIEWFDLNGINLPLEVRFRKSGDRFWPLGLPAEKKIGKFLTDAKASRQTRRKITIIADGEKIIWLCPLRPSELTKVKGLTKRVLQLKVRC